MNDFSRQTLNALKKQGITLIGLTVIPGDGDLPFATGERGYCVNDNGTHRVLNHAQVMQTAKGDWLRLTLI